MEKEKQQESAKKHIPWWLHLAVAILAYSFFKYVLPALPADQAVRENFAVLGNQLAPIIAIVFLLLSANALYKNVPKEKLEERDKQKDDEPE